MIRTGYRYWISKPKSGVDKNGKDFWKFRIRDTVEQGDDDNKYQYFDCFTPSPVLLIDGSKIRIDGINSINVRMYNGKKYYSLNLDITVEEDGIP